MKLLFCILLIPLLSCKAASLEIEPPLPPDSLHLVLPEDNTSFADGLWELLDGAFSVIRPDITEAFTIGAGMICTVMLLSIFPVFSRKANGVIMVCGAFAITSTLLSGTHSMIRLGVSTVEQMVDYGKLLLPVMTTGLAAQGGITSSAALYAGTALFNTLLGSFITRLLIPMVYLFLALATANCAAGNDLLKRLQEFIKWFLTWCLKTLLTVFTTYVTVTGVISGTTDAASLKATKVMLSSFVPVVGSILSDASESVLVSVSMAKNAAGIYGIFAILAIFLEPFLRIGIHYLLLKGTGAICQVFGVKSVSDLIEDFSSAMGFLLAMTGSVCLMLLISTICFLKGVG